jgi:hypothetical protein
MDGEDLLYTNKFVNTDVLSKEQLNEDANNFIPYRTLKERSVNNVRDTLERKVFKNNPLTQQELRGYGWNKGTLGNERPVLSDFARDIGESSYFRYKTTYLNVDSRMRDVSLYPRPNNYKVFLGRKFSNVESIKLIDYFFPEMNYPINLKNNVLMWFTVPYEMLIINGTEPTVSYYTGNLNLSGFRIDFNLLIDGINDFDKAKEVIGNNLYKNLFVTQVPEGNYTTEGMELEIERVWEKQQFFNSNFYTSVSYLFKDDDSPSKVFYRKPQKVRARINGETSEVNFLLRYEEYKVEKVETYNGKNYFDVYMRVKDPLIYSVEYLELANNEIYPIVFTGMPWLGGVNSGGINYVEFLPYKQIELNNGITTPPSDYVFKSYYTVIKDEGSLLPNVLRFYLYNTNNINNINQEIIFSYGEVIEYDGVCKELCEAKFGREAPFFFLTGNQNQLSNFLETVNNNICKINSDICIGKPCFEPVSLPLICRIVEEAFIKKINMFLCNTDSSSRILVNLLGFQNTLNNQAALGEDIFYVNAYTLNLLEKFNTYINMVETLTLIEREATNFLDCQFAKGKSNSVLINYASGNTLDFKLPVCKGANGKYYFYNENYFFMKLLNVGLNNNAGGTQIEQVKPTPNFGNGSSDVYEYFGETVKGYELLVFDTDPSVVDDCVIPTGSTAQGVQKLVKDVNNIFAKIKVSADAGSCRVDNPFTNEVIYYDGNLEDFDDFTVQLVDYEGKIIEMTKDHNFTIMIIEKMEVLKETNINSKTGFVNTVGSQAVIRNNFGS